ncbi:MAG: DUF4258 domain-containing protein [Spirochaetaceae bacterium]|nr:DUF4258 domain-containing protein [Spirochaetaceae bacterium]
MTTIEDLRRYCKNDSIFITNHAMERCRERGIVIKDIMNAVMTGEIIEYYPDDFPFPSCLVFGKSTKGDVIHICLSDEGESSKLITAYYPSLDKWKDGFKIRKEASE